MHALTEVVSDRPVLVLRTRWRSSNRESTRKPGLVDGDENRSSRSFTTLVGHCGKFNDEGRQVPPRSATGAGVDRTDTGVAYAADKFGQISMSFEQGEGATTRVRGRGSGCRSRGSSEPTGGRSRSRPTSARARVHVHRPSSATSAARTSAAADDGNGTGTHSRPQVRRRRRRHGGRLGDGSRTRRRRPRQLPEIATSRIPDRRRRAGNLQVLQRLT